MSLWRIDAARSEHIPPIAADMREADRREVWASHRHTPDEALRVSLESSVMAWTCSVSGVPAFMWGVGRRGSILSDTGVPWLLGTDLIRSIRREFLKQSRMYVDRMQEGFALLENHVHAENRLSVRWLQWCGFTVDMDAPVMINGENFYPFRRKA